MLTSIVIDLGYGDSGKGITVDFLAAQEPEGSLVIRFSGGHQVGHTVEHDGRLHTFSNFGAGTFRAVPTYYTQHCVIFPPAIEREYELLSDLNPKLIFHPLVQICTPYDMAFNRAIEKFNKHGSCGLGFGATVERNEGAVKFYALHAQQEFVIRQKLAAVQKYYLRKLKNYQSEPLMQLYIEQLEGYQEDAFVQACLANVQQVEQYPLANSADIKHLIFEGSQGVLLDQEHGFFPHVTRSHTTCKNAIETLTEWGLARNALDLYYVSRCYQNRHGNGPMSSELALDLVNNEKEANQTNEYQGAFRVGEIDADLLRYALECDALYHGHAKVHKHLVLTCLDQRPDFLVDEFVAQMPKFEQVLGSYSANSRDFRPLETVL